MKKLKENLIEELATLKHDHEQLVLQDQIKRKEFARAFKWYKQNNYSYDNSLEPILPSWEQIWVNLGKLLAARNFMDYEGNISELKCKLEDLENKIRNENI